MIIARSVTNAENLQLEESMTHLLSLDKSVDIWLHLYYFLWLRLLWYAFSYVWPWRGRYQDLSSCQRCIGWVWEKSYQVAWQGCSCFAISCPHSISSEIHLSIVTSINAKEVNATAVSQTMTLRCCSALPGYHVFSGCDSVSAFRYKGNAKGSIWCFKINLYSTHSIN